MSLPFTADTFLEVIARHNPTRRISRAINPGGLGFAALFSGESGLLAMRSDERGGRATTIIVIGDTWSRAGIPRSR
jgi:hypothetical protein